MSAASLSLGVGWLRCANGETHEFWLTLDGNRVGGGVFRSIHKDKLRWAADPERVYRAAVRAEAAAALPMLLARLAREEVIA